MKTGLVTDVFVALVPAHMTFRQAIEKGAASSSGEVAAHCFTKSVVISVALPFMCSHSFM